MPLLSTLRGLHVVCPGEIPAELGSLSNLVALDLNGNDLSGEIPPELGNLANVTLQILYGNDSACACQAAWKTRCLTLTLAACPTAEAPRPQSRTDSISPGRRSQRVLLWRMAPPVPISITDPVPCSWQA